MPIFDMVNVWYNELIEQNSVLDTQGVTGMCAP